MKSDEQYQIWKLSIKQFIDSTARSKPDITGGCVTIATACIALSLIRMPLAITKRRTEDPGHKKLLSLKITLLRKIQRQLADAAAQDLHIFNRFRFRSRKESPEQQAKEHQLALIDAIELPLKAARLINEAMSIAKESIAHCDGNILSDLAAGVLVLQATVRGILMLTSANINSLPKDEQDHFNRMKNQIGDESELLSNEMALVLERNSCKMIT